MKIIIKLIVAATIIVTSFTARAGSVSGYYRSNGRFVAPYYRWDFGSLGGHFTQYGAGRDYVYRNPYAAVPSVHVGGYTRADGVTVLPYYRTRPNNTLTDNLSYRGFGTIRVPRY